jgi:hypothetical protein
MNVILDSLKFFISFLGNNFGIVPDSEYFKHLPSLLKICFLTLPFIAGIFIFGYFIFLVIKRYDRQNPFIFSLMTAILIISAGAALYRYSRGSSIVSYYRFPTLFLIISIYISLMELLKNKGKQRPVWLGFLIFGIIFSISAYCFKIKTMAWHKRDLVSTFRDYQQGVEGNKIFGWSFGDPEPILKESIAKGIWKIPSEY